MVPGRQPIAYVRYCFDTKARRRGGDLDDQSRRHGRPRGHERPQPAAPRRSRTTASAGRRTGSPSSSIGSTRRSTPERAAIFTIGLDGKNLHQVTAVVGRRQRPRLVARRHRDRVQRLGRTEPDAEHLDDPSRRHRPHPAHHVRPAGPGDVPSHVVAGRLPDPVLAQPVVTDGWGDFFVMNRDGTQPARDRQHRDPREPWPVGSEPCAVDEEARHVAGLLSGGWQDQLQPEVLPQLRHL